MQRRYPSRFAFTLKELITVLCIITVVYAIVFPVYVQSIRPRHGRAELSYCLSNSKQIGLALMMYAQDYDEQFPPTFTRTSGREGIYAGTHTAAWGGGYTILVGPHAIPTVIKGLTTPYVRAVEVFECPTLRREVPDKQDHLTYMFSDLAAGVRMEYFTQPARTVLVADSVYNAFNFGHSYGPPDSLNGYALNIDDPDSRTQGMTLHDSPTRHNKGGIYVFADGHAKWTKPESVYFPPRENGDRAHGENGPDPAGDMVFDGRVYQATFHIK